MNTVLDLTCKASSFLSNPINILNHYNNNTIIIHFIETRLHYNFNDNKNADGLVNRLASNLVILNRAHTVAWLIEQESIPRACYTVCACLQQSMRLPATQ